MTEVPQDDHEAAIICRILKGDVNAYEQLVARNKAHIFKILSRHVPIADVDEISQMVFVKGYESLASFRGSSPIEHWFTRIALRTCCDYWRAKRKQSEVPLGATLMEAIDSKYSLAKFKDDCSAEHAREILELAMSRLSAEDRMVVTLHHIDGYSERETASLLGWSVAKVKFRAFKSRKALLKILTTIFPSR